jgi:Na+-transporting methylmalonyl-CoA/oxaloacetate decarboxylase gamma subunit
MISFKGSGNVFLFFLLLHICASWFLTQAQQQRRRFFFLPILV